MKQIESVLSAKEFLMFDVAMKTGRLSHAYLIVGNSDASNKLFSRAMVQKLVCQNHAPCQKCASCQKVVAGFHPDVFEYPKGKSFVVADSEDILANVNIKPLEADFKVFVINNVDNATVQAQNKLLKTIEEAPKNVVFIFNAVNQHNVLQTIKSRTQTIEIGNFDEKPLEHEEDYDFLVDMLKNMQKSSQTLKYVVKFANKKGFLERLQLLGQVFERVLFAKFEKISVFAEIAKNYQTGAIAEILENITLAKRQFEANVATNLIADNLLIKILEVRYKWNKNV